MEFILIGFIFIMLNIFIGTILAYTIHCIMLKHDEKVYKNKDVKHDNK